MHERAGISTSLIDLDASLCLEGGPKVTLNSLGPHTDKPWLREWDFMGSFYWSWYWCPGHKNFQLVALSCWLHDVLCLPFPHPPLRLSWSSLNASSTHSPVTVATRNAFSISTFPGVPYWGETASVWDLQVRNPEFILRFILINWARIKQFVDTQKEKSIVFFVKFPLLPLYILCLL